MRLDRLPEIWLDGDLRVAVADTRRARLLGLAGLRRLDPSDALLLPRCRSIHTFGMRFAIDVAFLDAHGEIVRVAGSVPPRRVVACRQARAALETAAGTAPRFLSLLDSQAVQ